MYAADFLIDGPQLGFLGKVPGIYLLSLILGIVSFTRHVFSALCSTAVKFGPPTQDRNAARTRSICDASGASSVSTGKTTSLTVTYYHVLVSPACTPSSVSAA